MRLTIAGFVAIYLITMVALALPSAIPEHLGEPGWPLHAQNHVLQSLFWIEGFGLLAVLVTLTAFRKRERWSWFAQLTSGTFMYGGYFGAIVITGGGAPGPLDDIVFGLLWILHTVALAASFGPVARQVPDAAPEAAPELGEGDALDLDAMLADEDAKEKKPTS